MSTVDVSQADLIRSHIEKRFDENYDYSRPVNKKNDIKDFVNAYPELKTTEEKIRKHYSEILKQVAEQKGKPHSEIGVKKPRVSSSVANAQSDMNAIIESKPQGEILQPDGINPNQLEVVNGMLVVPNTIHYQYDEQSVSATIDGLYQTIRAVFAPIAEELTDTEKASLGTIWKPIFDTFVKENWQVVGIAFTGTLVIIMPKIAKARKLRKENKLKKIAETKNIEEKGKNESEISGTGKPVVDNSDDLDPDAGNNN